MLLETLSANLRRAPSNRIDVAVAQGWAAAQSCRVKIQTPCIGIRRILQFQVTHTESIESLEDDRPHSCLNVDDGGVALVEHKRASHVANVVNAPEQAADGGCFKRGFNWNISI